MDNNINSLYISIKKPLLDIRNGFLIKISYLFNSFSFSEALK